MIGYQAANCTPPKMEPIGGSRIAICHDQTMGLIHWLEIEGILLFKICLGPFGTGLDRVEVHINRPLLAFEVEA